MEYGRNIVSSLFMFAAMVFIASVVNPGWFAVAFVVLGVAILAAIVLGIFEVLSNG